MHKAVNPMRLLLCVLVSLACEAVLRGQEHLIRVVYPLEDQEVAARDSTFIFGSTTAGSRLWINGHRIPVYPNGAFLAYIPVSPGDFIFHCVSVLQSDTLFIDRRVHIPHRLRPFPLDFLGFDSSYVEPRQSITLLPGDLLEVSVKGTPGCEAFFDVEGLFWNVPMTERLPVQSMPWGEAVFGDLKVDREEVAGIYTGTYQIQPWDQIRDGNIRFTLVNDRSDTVSIEAGGILTVDPSPVPEIAVLTEETVIARPSPGHAYAWFLPAGVKVWITGNRGSWFRVRLAQGQEAWIPDGSFRRLPPGTLVPKSVVGSVRTVRMDDRVRVIIPLNERLPFHIRQSVSPPSLVVTLYGAWADTDWIPQDFSDPVIEDIRWQQVSVGVYELCINLTQDQQWGYDTRYRGSTFQLDIKRKPLIRKRVFKGISICLDPGHHPEKGAVGPTGLEERDVNLDVASQLRDMLEDQGALVIMTREKEEGISLYTRPKLAAIVDADILISIHFNALPDGVNPWQNNGSSTYYFHPMGNRLARLIHAEVLDELELPDFGVYYANLALCRPTQMPAVLTEEAFMMIPEHEMLLAQPEFRMRCARAIFRGLKRFLAENR